MIKPFHKSDNEAITLAIQKIETCFFLVNCTYETSIEMCVNISKSVDIDIFDLFKTLIYAASIFENVFFETSNQPMKYILGYTQIALFFLVG